MRYLFTFLFALLALGPAKAQVFERLYGNSLQPSLSQPLSWVSAPSTAAPSLPEAFALNPELWAFAPYTAKTALPTSKGQDVWVRFTLAATPLPQSWIIRIPRLTIRKVSLYSLDASGFEPVQSAGASLAHNSWNRRTRTPSFEVVTGSLEKTYFLRFEHGTAITERPELMSQSDFADGAGRFGTLLGLMLGMFGLLLLACMAAFAMARNTVFISLAAFVAAVLLHYLVLMGYGTWRIWPGNAYLNQAMQWTAPLLAMAACCWFFAQASYVKDSSLVVYRLLCLVTVGSFALAVLKLIGFDQIERQFLNGWAALVLAVIVGSLMWLSLRDRRWNLWLLAGLLPIAAAGSTRLAYSYGWLAQMEFALVASVFLTQFGLGWLFMVLVWRSRAALMASELAAALNSLDARTGLIQEWIALRRLSQMLKRATQLKLGCGVIMLHWLDFAGLMKMLSPEKQNALLKHLGQVLNKVARDIDTAARLGDGYFMILVEGPISRSTLASLSTQVLTACIRTSEKFGLPSNFGFHIAIWHATLVPVSADEVIESLKSRLNQMAYGTKRPMQFVDVAASDLSADANQEPAQRRDDLVAKIDAIEASPSVQAVLMPEATRR